MKLGNNYYPIYVRELDNFYTLRKTRPLTKNSIKKITDSYRSTKRHNNNTKTFQPDLYVIDEKNEYLTMPLYSKLKVDNTSIVQSVKNLKKIENGIKGENFTIFELKNNNKIRVDLYKNQNSITYKLEFSYVEQNEFSNNIAKIEFYINYKNILMIKKVELGIERQMGWCSIIIYFLMELINHWILTENIKIKGVDLTNASYREGNISGTICYIKYIGKYYPFFKHGRGETTYYLTPYLELKNVKWENILEDLGLDEFLTSRQDRFFSFRKKTPKLSIF